MSELSGILFHAHSGIRYLVLLAGVVSFLYSLVGALRNRPWDRAGRVLQVTFVGLLDVQVLLGLILIFTRVFYPALWGHVVLMALAAMAAHAASVVNRRRPPEARTHMTAALGSAGALVLIVGGIKAIGGSLL